MPGPVSAALPPAAQVTADLPVLDSISQLSRLPVPGVVADVWALEARYSRGWRGWIRDIFTRGQFHQLGETQQQEEGDEGRPHDRLTIVARLRETDSDSGQMFSSGGQARANQFFDFMED